jgi:CrcB protein
LRKFISIAAGGMAGAILRFLIRSIHFPAGLPWGTLAVNVSGSFLLALIMTAAMGGLRIHEDVKTGLIAGFVGAYTTFSSVCQEGVAYLAAGRAAMAVAYIVLSTALGLAAAFAGYRLAARLTARSAAKAADEEEDL